MASFNKVILMGHLTRDPETRHVGSGWSLTSFGLAMNRSFKSSDGSDGEEVAFVDCTAWGRTGEIIAQYLNKGSPLIVEGRLKTDEWEDGNGQKRTKLGVVVESFTFVSGGGSGSRGGSGGSGMGGRSHKGSRGSGGGSRREVSYDNDPNDIPF